MPLPGCLVSRHYAPSAYLLLRADITRCFRAPVMLLLYVDICFDAAMRHGGAKRRMRGHATLRLVVVIDIHADAMPLLLSPPSIHMLRAV